MMDSIRRVPDGAVLTLESVMRNALSIGTMAIAMGLHVGCGIEDNRWDQKGEHISSARQAEQIAAISNQLYRKVATCKDAKRIYPVGEWYQRADQTLSRLGLPPNRDTDAKGVRLRLAY